MRKSRFSEEQIALLAPDLSADRYEKAPPLSLRRALLRRLIDEVELTRPPRYPSPVA